MIRQLQSSWLRTPLGSMLAISNSEALVLLEFEGRRGLEASIERLSKSATITPGHTEPIAAIERELGAYFAGESCVFRTPFELAGTDFQLQVWRELLNIPAGTTINYLQLAHAVGRPAAFRAVAQANGANRLAVIVPCHRVINSSGALAGYGGGVERKKWLLEHERTVFGSWAELMA